MFGDSIAPCAVKVHAVVCSSQDIPKWVGAGVSNHHNQDLKNMVAWSPVETGKFWLVTNYAYLGFWQSLSALNRMSAFGMLCHADAVRS
jgi:hypothetical protein